MKLADEREIALMYERARKYFKSEGVVKRSHHLFRSGGEGSHYIDFDNVVNDPNRCEVVSNLYADEIQDIAQQRKIDLLAPIEKASGGTIGIIRLAGAISILTGLPNVPIRLKKEIMFEKVKIPPIEGKPWKGRLNGPNVVILTDHCTTGSEVLNAVNVIEYNGGIVTDVISYSYIPDQLNWDVFKDRGIAFHFFFTYPEELEDSNPPKMFRRQSF